ncbi:MAG: [protein-PII] uridylyltransferase, partial [Ignavibacteriaceae bacterium]
MTALIELKDDFIKKRDRLFKDISLRKDSFSFSKKYSHLVEEYVKDLAEGKNYNFVLASSGSFSRMELSPASDIDLMFIAESVNKNDEDIAELVTKFWDSGIEASHTVRDFSDIKKYLKEDLHTFTQFFETKFLIGSEEIYSKWNEEIFSLLKDKIVMNLLNDF